MSDLSQKCTKCDFRWGSAPTSWAAYSAFPQTRVIAVFKVLVKGEKTVRGEWTRRGEAEKAPTGSLDPPVEQGGGDGRKARTGAWVGASRYL